MTIIDKVARDTTEEASIALAVSAAMITILTLTICCPDDATGRREVAVALKTWVMVANQVASATIKAITAILFKVVAITTINQTTTTFKTSTNRADTIATMATTDTKTKVVACKTTEVANSTIT